VHFWQYVRESDKNSIEPEVYGNHLSQPCEAAEAFAECFKNVFNNAYLRDGSTASCLSDSLSLASVSDSDVSRP
jgi:hypothetical protein